MAKEKEEKTKTSVKKPKSKGFKIAKNILIIFMILGLAGLAGYFYREYNDLKKNPVSAEEAQKQENRRIIDSVARLYELPKDEEPTIFFVSDKDKLSEEYKNQEFFQKAQNGDYILIYEKGKLALLYRPKENRLVDVRPYTVQNSISIALVGPEAVRTSAEKILKDSFNNEISIATKTEAKNAYTGITVVDTSGKYAEQAKKIAETLKGKVGNLPEGENKPQGADLVILVGAPQAPAPAE
jgi:hypothetical protein